MHFHRLISDKIEYSEGSCIALLGGGGKTSLLHKLAYEYAKFYPNVLQTSLTKTAFYLSDKPLILKDINIEKLNLLKSEKNPLFLIGEKISQEKLKGISETDLDRIRHQFDITIFECDGARKKPLKAHTDYDPIVPEFATHTIIIVGAEVANTRISDGLVHRPELFCKTWNVQPNYQLNIDFIVKVLTSNEGYHSKLNSHEKISYFVNKWDDHQKNAEDLAKAIYQKTGKPAYYGSVQNNVLNSAVL
ncbi:MAG: selenium cofactor biosynthesis protein YqeC [Candidatus Neomarinimicrobiota bacterium]